MTDSDGIFKLLTNLVDDAFNTAFTSETQKEKKDMEEHEELTGNQDGRDTTKGPKYISIEDYKQRTGKRFRKTKDQTDRGLTRNEAFNESYGGSK